MNATNGETMTMRAGFRPSKDRSRAAASCCWAMKRSTIPRPMALAAGSITRGAVNFRVPCGA
jgi:hypothetical protein